MYEIDGLKAGPILLGEAADIDWLSVAKPAIEARMSRYNASETHFALMSIKKSRVSELKSEIAAAEARLAYLESGGNGEVDLADQTTGECYGLLIVACFYVFIFIILFALFVCL